MKKGNCHGLPPDTMMPEGDHGAGGRVTKNHDRTKDPISTNDHEKLAAAKYCNNTDGECASKTECLEYAITTCQRFGVWGGKTSEELNRLIITRGTGRYGCSTGGGRY